MTMDVEKLQQLCKQYPEVQDLLRDNYSLSVEILVERLNTFDRNHTKVQAKLTDRLSKAEDRLDRASLFSRELRKRIEKLETEIKEAAGHPAGSQQGGNS